MSQTQRSLHAPTKRLNHPFYNFQTELSRETTWQEKSQQLLLLDTLPEGEAISWAGYFSKMEVSVSIEPSIFGFLPLFEEKAASWAMQKHGLKVICSAIEKLNPGQIPVVCGDQPIYAILKQIQWQYNDYNESKIVILLGGLHIELHHWGLLGKLLMASGWDEALFEAGITTSGRANSILHATHLKRCRYMHEVSVIVFCKLRKLAFDNSGSNLEYNDWITEQCSKSPTFFYWDLIIRLQTLAFMFVRSIRQRNLNLYISTLEKLTPLSFSLDSMNYSRWVPIHIRDLKSLPENIKEQFNEGNFTVTKTRRKFSSIAIDHSHEQSNKIIKGSGGAVGLFQSHQQHVQWLLTRPQIAQLLLEFERRLPNSSLLNDSIDIDNDGDDNDDGAGDVGVDNVELSKISPQHHHEFTPSFQKKFKRNAEQLLGKILAYGNPFSIDTNELLKLTNQDSFHPSVKTSITNLEKNGQEQYDAFVRDVLQDSKKSIHEPISKNNYNLMSTPVKKTNSTASTKVQLLKHNNEIFSQLVAILQQRKVSLLKVFSFELHSFSPSISNFGDLHHSSDKGELLSLLKSPCHNSPEDLAEFRPDASVILDGEMLPEHFPPKKSMTFREYAEMLGKEILSAYFFIFGRIDIVFNTFVEGSVKTAVRKKQNCKQVIRRHVAPTNLCPDNWKSFLKDPINRKQLNIVLAELLTSLTYQQNRQLIVTCQRKVLTSGSLEMEESNIEDARCRILLHVKHALTEGISRIKIITFDEDVPIVGLGVYHLLRSQHHFEDIVIELGTGKKHQTISLNELATSLGPLHCQALPFFHCLTGANLTSAFKGVGKKKAYQALKAYKEAEQTLADMYTTPFQDLTENDTKFRIIERFIIICYSRTSELSSINEARIQLYFAGKKDIEHIPPTQDALLLHVKRSLYETGMLKNCLTSQQSLPSPLSYGWKESDDHDIKWEPEWIKGKEASREVREFVKCGCKNVCTHTSRCSCSAASLRCTLLCSCKCQNRVSFD